MDLARVEDLSIWYKNIQCWDTRRYLMLMYGPTNVPTEVLADELTTLLENSETKFRKDRPGNWPDSVHGGEFPKLYCTLDWAKGGAYIVRPKIFTKDTSHRKVPVFTYAGKEAERIATATIVKEVKRQSIETRGFREQAFLQYQLPKQASA